MISQSAVSVRLTRAAVEYRIFKKNGRSHMDMLKEISQHLQGGSKEKVKRTTEYLQ